METRSSILEGVSTPQLLASRQQFVPSVGLGQGAKDLGVGHELYHYATFGQVYLDSLENRIKSNT